ncbi:7039_t:CDS:2 [Entrophospora sp. SA101]|nr:7039_t:CDS:2 [Entrophospora sp. SA101]
MDISRSEACSDYDDIEEPSSIEELKGLLMKFTAMTHIRLQSILPILIDNDIDDPDILLLIDNEQFLHDIRGKNGSEISRGNSLLLWHGIQELRKKSNSNINEIQNLNNQRHQYNHASHNHHDRNNHDRNNHNIRNYNHNIRNYSIDNNDDIHDYNDNNSNVIIPTATTNTANATNNTANNTNANIPSSSANHSTYIIKQRVKAPKLSMSTIEEVHTRVNRVLSVVTSENNRRKQIALTHNPNCKPTLKFEDFVAELKRSHRIPVAFGTLRDMRFAYMLKILSKQCYDRVLASNKTTNVTEFYRACQEACEENFTDEQLESALPWLDLKAKMYYKQQQ